MNPASGHVMRSSSFFFQFDMSALFHFSHRGSGLHGSLKISSILLNLFFQIIIFHQTYNMEEKFLSRRLRFFNFLTERKNVNKKPARLMFSFFYPVQNLHFFDVIRESSHLMKTGENGLFLAGTYSFLRCLLCKLLEHWEAKWRNLKGHDWHINFLNETVYCATFMRDLQIFSTN